MVGTLSPLLITCQKKEVDWKGDLSKVMPDGLRVFVEIELGHSKSNLQISQSLS